ncbi:MAG: hypothetical protein EA369_01110 [Bradymonadales bacterium]|nr:MAG: hypothetical protein EA369_01110 [Bradymonadales bacterium]
MKISSRFFILFFGLGIFAVQLDARDLSYKISGGYKQVFTNGFVTSNGDWLGAQQIHGVSASYGIAKDMQVEAFFGMTRNFRQFLVGPSFRYDIHRLIVRDSRFWEHLNLFVQGSFFLKSGSDVETGVVLQLPYFGFEIFPFRDNHFAIQSSAGITIDLVKKSGIGFTQSMFGDVGLRYYF